MDTMNEITEEEIQHTTTERTGMDIVTDTLIITGKATRRKFIFG